MVPEIEEAVYGGGILGGYLRVFRGFAGGQEHSFHHGKNGMAVVGLAHVFQAGEVEEREQLFERVFRLAILEEAFHIEDTEEGFRLGLGELSCGAEELGLLPCPGGGLFRFFGGRLLPLALSETCGFSLALLSEQGRFHRIEGFKETFLPCRRLFAGEAHREEDKAVAGEPVGGIFSDTYVAEDVLVLLVEYLSDDEGGSRRNAAFGLDHVFNGGLEDFLGGGLFYFHPIFLFEIIRLAYRFLL